MERDTIKAYAVQHWKGHLHSVSDLSRRSGRGNDQPLVDDATLLYSFDAMSAAPYPENLRPTSVDAFYFTRCGFGFVEFKSGFVPKITRDNFDRSKATCPQIKTHQYVCDDYWTLFWEKQKRERTILIDSLMLKAIESYITFEKMLFRQAEHLDVQDAHKKLTIVIDVEPVKDTYDFLTELAEVDPCPSCKRSIGAALNRLQKHDNGCHYFYDEICVVSAEEFKAILRAASQNDPNVAELLS